MKLPSGVLALMVIDDNVSCPDHEHILVVACPNSFLLGLSNVAVFGQICALIVPQENEGDFTISLNEHRGIVEEASTSDFRLFVSKPGFKFRTDKFPTVSYIVVLEGELSEEAISRIKPECDDMIIKLHQIREEFLVHP